MAWSDFTWFGGAFVDALGPAGLDLTSETAVKALLTDATYTPNQDTHTHLDDVTGELTDPSYGRVTVTGTTVGYDSGSNRITFTADPFAFTELDDTFRHLVLFYDTGTAGTSTLIGFSSSDSDVTASANDVTVTPNVSGLLYVDVT